MSQTLFFDTETTGLPDKGLNWEHDFQMFPHLVQMAWIAGDNEKEYIIKPDNYEIPLDTTEIHGITQEKAMELGVNIKDVLDEFFVLAEKSDKIVGHNIYFDTSIIKANALRLGYDKEKIIKALDKTKRFDTMQKSMKLLKVGKYPKLGELYNFLFNKEIQDQHTALADVKATKECYEVLIK